MKKNVFRISPPGPALKNPAKADVSTGWLVGDTRPPKRPGHQATQVFLICPWHRPSVSAKSMFQEW